MLAEKLNFQTLIFFQDGNSALMFAAYGGHKAVVKELLEHGADVTLVNCNLDTAYDIATKLKRTESK